MVEMFKIKDNVDLKELEKFGFEKDDRGNYEKYIRVYTSLIVLKNRKILKDVDDEGGIVEYKDVYDLIQAGLVEKEDI